MPDSPSAASTAAAAAMESGKHCPPPESRTIRGIFWFFTESLGEQTKASAKQQKAARGRRMKARPTLRVRRRASKLLFPQDSVKNHSSTPPWHSYLKNKNGYCGGSRPHTVPVFLMQSRGDYSAAGAKKEICVAPVMASADSIVMGAVSTLSVAKEPS